MNENEAAAFFEIMRATTSETRIAADAGRQALRALAVACVYRDNGQALIVRRFLLNLYNGSNPKVDLTDLYSLDWTLRKQVCAVLLGMNGPGLSDIDIRQAFEAAGDVAAKWFLENASD